MSFLDELNNLDQNYLILVSFLDEVQHQDTGYLVFVSFFDEVEHLDRLFSLCVISWWVRISGHRLFISRVIYWWGRTSEHRLFYPCVICWWGRTSGHRLFIRCDIFWWPRKSCHWLFGPYVISLNDFSLNYVSSIPYNIFSFLFLTPESVNIPCHLFIWMIWQLISCLIDQSWILLICHRKESFKLSESNEVKLTEKLVKSTFFLFLTFLVIDNWISDMSGG